MNILITGGLGYIGGRVANYLKEKKPHTHIFLTTRNRNRKLPQWVERFTILQMNLLNEASIVNCLENKNIDTIIHLAAINEIDSIKNPEMAWEINIKGTYRLLNSAYNIGIKNFIYFSTFHVYGDVLESVITEKTPTRPFHPYAISHRAAEDIVRFFNYYYGINFSIFRLSNGYGCPQDKEVNRWSLLFNDLCKQVVLNRKISLKSSGKQYRDFISLHNIARAVYHFLFVIPDKWKNEVYNLGGNCTMTVLDVAKMISIVYSSMYRTKEIEIDIKADSIDLKNVYQFEYNIKKLKETGFILEDNIIQEIENTIKLCNEFL